MQVGRARSSASACKPVGARLDCIHSGLTRLSGPPFVFPLLSFLVGALTSDQEAGGITLTLQGDRDYS